MDVVKKQLNFESKNMFADLSDTMDLTGDVDDEEEEEEEEEENRTEESSFYGDSEDWQNLDFNVDYLDNLNSAPNNSGPDNLKRLTFLNSRKKLACLL